MLKRIYAYCLFYIAIQAHSEDYMQQVVIEGVLRQAERQCIKDPQGAREVTIARNTVLVTEQPLILSRSLTLGNQKIAATETSYSSIAVELSEEFLSLIGKRVRCSGHFKEDLTLNVEIALDCESLKRARTTVFYEPEQVTLSGILYEMVYPGPPEYTSVSMGDRPETAIILCLNDPIDVLRANTPEDDEPEQGVRELQVVFSNSTPTQCPMRTELTLKGSLYHAHTAHHRRRVLMTVISWDSSAKKGDPS